MEKYVNYEDGGYTVLNKFLFCFYTNSYTGNCSWKKEFVMAQYFYTV